MSRGVSMEHIDEIVSDERLKELKEYTENLGTYDIIALYKFLQMRRNVITCDNNEKFSVGQTVKIFDIGRGIEYVGSLTEINGAKSKVDTENGIFRVGTDMLYE